MTEDTSSPYNLEVILDGSEAVQRASSQVTVLIKQENVDNPGLGNCAFYAFAIGIIHIIQEERTYSKEMFQRWVELNPEVESCYDEICDFNFQESNNKLLNKLQMLLRQDIFNLKLAELREACAGLQIDNSYTKLIGTSSFIHFAEAFYGNNTSSGFNEYVNSSQIQAAFAKIKKAMVKDTKLMNEENKSRHEQSTLAQLFIALLYGEKVNKDSINETTQFMPSSPIVFALQRITENYFWGTHLDLDYLSRAFKVNLHTLQNGQSSYDAIDVQEQHTITVDNQSNFHWTTLRAVAEKTPMPNPHDEANQKEKKNGFKWPFNFFEKTAIKPKVTFEQPKLNKLEINNEKESLLQVASAEEKELSLDCPSEAKLKLNQAELRLLKDKINSAVMSYRDYSKGILFSLFHRHGESGRKRASAFQITVAKTKDYDEAKALLIDFLKNRSNGNTHPHSFRTMLLTELLTPAEYELTYKNISSNFNTKLAQFENSLIEDSAEHFVTL